MKPVPRIQNVVISAASPIGIHVRPIRSAGPDCLSDACGHFGRATWGSPLPWWRGSLIPTQMKTWMDTRHCANSPWSSPYVQVPEPPPDGRWVTQVTFDEPGEYVLRAVARDGAMSSYENVAVTVTR